MIFIILHIIICIVIAIVLTTDRYNVKWSVFPLVVFVPIVGALVFLLEVRNANRGEDRKEIGLDSFKIDEVRYKRIDVDNKENEDITVPLEEAMAINDNGTQRVLLMEVLQSNPTDKVALLQKASMSSDTELTHYATTTMMSIQGDYEQKIRELSEQLDKTPDHVSVLRKIRSTIKKYIASGLITGNILRIYQEKLIEVVDKLLVENPSNEALLIDKASTFLDMENCEAARPIVEKLEKIAPSDEQVVMLQINYYRMMHNGEKVRNIAEEMLHAKEYHTLQFRNQMEFFLHD